jgi:hypothetical protein
MTKPNDDAVNAALKRLYNIEKNNAFRESAILGQPFSEGVDMYDVFMNVCREDPELFVLAFLEVVQERNELDEKQAGAETALDTLLRSNAGISLDFLDALMDESVNMALQLKEGKKSE